MSVYVDDLFSWPVEATAAAAQAVARHNDGHWCHLLADTLEELEAFARNLQFPTRWRQGRRPGEVPHYDLSPGKRLRALRLGVIEVDSNFAAELIRTWRERTRARPAESSER